MGSLLDHCQITIIHKGTAILPAPGLSGGADMLAAAGDARALRRNVGRSIGKGSSFVKEKGQPLLDRVHTECYKITTDGGSKSRGPFSRGPARCDEQSTRRGLRVALSAKEDLR